MADKYHDRFPEVCVDGKTLNNGQYPDFDVFNYHGHFLKLLNQPFEKFRKEVVDDAGQVEYLDRVMFYDRIMDFVTLTYPKVRGEAADEAIVTGLKALQEMLKLARTTNELYQRYLDKAEENAEDDDVGPVHSPEADKLLAKLETFQAPAGCWSCLTKAVADVILVCMTHALLSAGISLL